MEFIGFVPDTIPSFSVVLDKAFEAVFVSEANHQLRRLDSLVDRLNKIDGELSRLLAFYVKRKANVEFGVRQLERNAYPSDN